MQKVKNKTGKLGKNKPQNFREWQYHVFVEMTSFVGANPTSVIFTGGGKDIRVSLLNKKTGTVIINNFLINLHIFRPKNH